MCARNIWWSKLPQKFWWNKGWIIAQPQSPGCRDAPLTLGAGRPSSAAFWSIERVELAAESVSEGKSLWLAVLKQITEQEEKRKEKKESPPSLSPEHARFHPFTAAALDFSCHLQLSIRRTPHQKWLHYVWGGKSCFTVTNSIFSTFWFPFLSDDYRLTLHGGMERYFLSCRCRM